MIASLIVARRGSGIRLENDPEQLMERVNALRNALIPIRDRQPLCFDHSERRRSARVPLHVPVEITPLAFEKGIVHLPDAPATSLEAFTTDLSLKGMGFKHEEPFDKRHVIVTFERPDIPAVSLLVEVCWSVPLDVGGNHSGGRLLALVEFTDRGGRHGR